MRQGAALFIWELALAVNQVRVAGIMIMIKWAANKKKTKY